MQLAPNFHLYFRHATFPTYVASYFFPILLAVYEVYRIAYWVVNYGLNLSVFKEMGYEFTLMLVLFETQIVIESCFLFLAWEADTPTSGAAFPISHLVSCCRLRCLLATSRCRCCRNGEGGEIAFVSCLPEDIYCAFRLEVQQHATKCASTTFGEHLFLKRDPKRGDSDQRRRQCSAHMRLQRSCCLRLTRIRTIWILRIWVPCASVSLFR